MKITSIKKEENVSKLPFYVACFLLGLSSLLLLRIYLSPALVPDEAWFFRISQGVKKEMQTHGFWHTYLHTPNSLGYGAAYWVFYSFFDDLMSFRIASWMCTLFFPLWILFQSYKNPEKKENLLALILFLITPFFWWTGKITGSEVFATFFSVLALVFIDFKNLKSYKFFHASFFLGVSSGIKLTSISYLGAFIITIFCIHFFSKEKEEKSWIENIICISTVLFFFSLGFLFVNPLALFSSNIFWANTNKVLEAMPLSSLWDTLWANMFEWDAVFTGGLSYWSYPITIFIILLVFLVFQTKKKREALFVTLALFFHFLLITYLASKKLFHGWYWFSHIALLSYLIVKTELNKKASIFVIACIVISASFNIPFIKGELTRRFWHEKTLQQTPLAAACIQDMLDKKQIRQYELWNYSEVEANLESYLKPEGGLWPYSFWARFTLNKKEITLPQNKIILITLGDRLTSVQPHIKEKVTNLKDNYQGVSEEGNCGYINWVLFQPSINP